MRQIKSVKITEIVGRLYRQANFFLPEDVLKAIETAYQLEKNDTSKGILAQIIENARIASNRDIALCQDTGIAEVFIKMGQNVEITGDNITEAVNAGIAKATVESFLRKSIVADPLDRKNTKNNTPCEIHLEPADGSKIEITVLAKGGGSENASALKMLEPWQGWEGVKGFVVDAVKLKGISSCPPLIVGVGIGGSFSSVGLLAKKALLRTIGSEPGSRLYAQKEKELLNEINALGIGPMGLGGKTTVLSVQIEAAPCHIATLPVAVSMQCHSLRRKTEII
jgi:fumarate hydratase subunit alpha